MKLYKPNSNPSLYHISELNCDGKTFIPRIPEDAYIGEEDIKHKRICVSTSIIGCIVNNHVFKPSKNDVPDVQITREKWITKRVKMKCIGVVTAYAYTLNKGHFRWVEKY